MMVMSFACDFLKEVHKYKDVFNIYSSYVHVAIDGVMRPSVY